MMMMGSSFGFMTVVWSLLAAAIMLGFALIIWIMSSKEEKNLKLAGQIIAGTIAVLTVIVLIWGLVSAVKIMGMQKRYEKGMRMMGGKEAGRMMDKMMKDPEMMKMMEKMKRYGR